MSSIVSWIVFTYGNARIKIMPLNNYGEYHVCGNYFVAGFIIFPLCGSLPVSGMVKRLSNKLTSHFANL